jgi:hypothetical protein
VVSFLVLFIILFQQFPDLPSPTPWQTPTPAPTINAFIDDANELVATAQADQYSFDTTENQIYFNGRPILPNLESSNSIRLFSYMKWIVSSGSQAVLGPFSPLMIPLQILIGLSFISLFVYFWENVIATIYKIASFVLSLVIRVFGMFF